MPALNGFRLRTPGNDARTSADIVRWRRLACIPVRRVLVVELEPMSSTCVLRRQCTTTIGVRYPRAGR